MRLAIMTLPITLVACGGGGDSGSNPLPSSDGFDPEADVVNACDSNYYREIAGEYGGQIEYIADHPGDGDEVCSWETEMQITTLYTSDPQFKRFCDLKARMKATPLPGSTPTCSAMDTGGDMVDSLKASTPDVWESPPYPVDATVTLPASLPGENAIYPVGQTIDQVNSFMWVFDGRGNAVIPEAQSGVEWSGVLVKE